MLQSPIPIKCIIYLYQFYKRSLKLCNLIVLETRKSCECIILYIFNFFSDYLAEGNTWMAPFSTGIFGRTSLWNRNSSSLGGQQKKASYETDLV